MIQRRKQVSQVSKTSSSCGTCLWSMQGNACERWTLGVMFPPRYRVSNCEGYKQGFSWLRMKKILRKQFMMRGKNPLKAQYWKWGHEMQSQLNTKKYPFLCIVVYLVWKRGKLVQNKRIFKSNLRVWKIQVHSAIFSIFDNKSENILTKTHYVVLINM